VGLGKSSAEAEQVSPSAANSSKTLLQISSQTNLSQIWQTLSQHVVHPFPESLTHETSFKTAVTMTAIDTKVLYRAASVGFGLTANPSEDPELP
jgi:hypothetical protein